MDYQLAKELERAGWPQEGDEKSTFVYCDGLGPYIREFVPALGREWIAVPTLEELIEACAIQGSFFTLEKGETVQEWRAYRGFYPKHLGSGPTPTQAVAHLWLALNKKQ